MAVKPLFKMSTPRILAELHKTSMQQGKSKGQNIVNTGMSQSDPDQFGGSKDNSYEIGVSIKATSFVWEDDAKAAGSTNPAHDCEVGNNEAFKEARKIAYSILDDYCSKFMSNKVFTSLYSSPDKLIPFIPNLETGDPIVEKFKIVNYPGSKLKSEDDLKKLLKNGDPWIGFKVKFQIKA